MTLTGADGAPVQRCGRAACKKAATERLEHAAQRSAKHRKLAASESALGSAALDSPRRSTAATPALTPPPLPPPLEPSSLTSSGDSSSGAGDAASKTKAQRLKLAEQKALIESQVHALEQQREGAKTSGIAFPDENAKHLVLLIDARRSLDEKIARFQSHVQPTRGGASGSARCAICTSTPVVGTLASVSFCVECYPSTLTTVSVCNLISFESILICAQLGCSATNVAMLGKIIDRFRKMARTFISARPV